MQLAGIASLGLLIAGGVFTVLLKSNSGGSGRAALLQGFGGITIGLAATMTVLIMMTDLIPDDLEWTVGATFLVVGLAIVVAVRLRNAI
jgi:hypothetical protein